MIDYILNFVANSKDNFVSDKDAIYPSFAGIKIYEDPIVKFAYAEESKDHEDVDILEKCYDVRNDISQTLVPVAILKKKGIYRLQQSKQQRLTQSAINIISGYVYAGYKEAMLWRERKRLRQQAGTQLKESPG